MKIAICIISLVYFLLNFKNVTCQTCKGANQNIEVSENELQKLPHGKLRHHNGHVVKKGIAKVTINCSSYEPVFWEVKTAKVYAGTTKIGFYVKITPDISSESPPRFCYTTSITFENFDESITGRYSCRHAHPPKSYSEDLHIFGGNDGLFLHRGQQFQRDGLDFKQELKDKNNVVLPCAQDYPKDTIVEYNGYNNSGLRTVNTTEKLPITYPTLCQGLFCAELTSILDQNGTLNNLKNFTITCKSSMKSENFVTIHSLATPDISVFPKERNMNLTVNEGQKMKFSCQSVIPVRIETNYKHQQKIISTVNPDEYYQYKSELEFSLPTKDWNSFFRKYLNEWKNINMTVSCNNQVGKKLHVWSYNFFNTFVSFPEQIDQDVANTLRTLTEGFCTTLDLDSAKVYFVPCSTYTECQMKAPLLYSSENYRLKTRKDESHSRLSANFVEFKVPNNVSGMLRCVGFLRDFFTIFYPNIEGDEEMPHYPIPSEKVVYTYSDDVRLPVELYSPKPNASINASKIFEGEFIRMQCTIQLMIIISHPVWILLFKNNTEKIVPSPSLINYTADTAAEMYTVSSTLKIESTDIIGLSCESRVIQTVPPIIWKNGVLEQNTNLITSEIRRGSVNLEVNARPQEVPKESNTVKILGITFGVLFILVSIFSVWLYFRQKSLKEFVDRLQQEEIEHFLNGRPELISSNEIANDNAQNVAYDTSKEILLSDLEIDFKTILGSGEFGIVFKGHLLKNEESVCVAVKTVKTGATLNYIKSAMAELKVMLYIKNHENIVGVIGACTQNLIEHQLYVVMEYCSAGNLLNYLRQNGNSFVNEVSKGMHIHIAIAKSEGADDDELPDYRNIEKSSSGIMTTTSLIKWALQIANGMNYISSINVVHGDLAARNILLDGKLTAKISDFGLSKKLYQYSNYIRKKSKSVPQPWRWLAVESLNFTEFSPASDVWSFGVTLWEIFSLGATPYPGQNFNPEFVKMLTDGFRMGLPEYSTYEIYNIIRDCWRKDPLLRPNFGDIHKSFETMIGLKGQYTNIEL